MTPTEKLTGNVKVGTEIVKNAIYKVNPANFNSEIKNSFPVITYICLFLVFCIAFVAIYIRNSVLIGVTLLYVINLVYSLFLVKDMFSSEKSEQIITFVITAILAMNAVSSTFVMMTLKNLHANFNKKGDTLKLSKKNRKNLSIYFTMFITTIAFTWFLALFYFGENENANFFDYVFVGKIFSPRTLMIIFILKICVCLAGLGLSGYMVFLGERFTKLKNTQYIK
jgi:hypothetical protein